MDLKEGIYSLLIAISLDRKIAKFVSIIRSQNNQKFNMRRGEKLNPIILFQELNTLNNNRHIIYDFLFFEIIFHPPLHSILNIANNNPSFPLLFNEMKK